MTSKTELTQNIANILFKDGVFKKGCTEIHNAIIAVFELV